MANKRTVIQLPINQDPAMLHDGITKLLTADGYHETTYNKTGVNEIIWKKGTGFLTAMHFIKLDYQPGVLIVSGWIASGIDTLTFTEQPLEGFMAAIPKSSCKKTVDKIVQWVQVANGGAPMAR